MACRGRGLLPAEVSPDLDDQADRHGVSYTIGTSDSGLLTTLRVIFVEATRSSHLAGAPAQGLVGLAADSLVIPLLDRVRQCGFVLLSFVLTIHAPLPSRRSKFASPRRYASRRYERPSATGPRTLMQRDSVRILVARCGHPADQVRVLVRYVGTAESDLYRRSAIEIGKRYTNPSTTVPARLSRMLIFPPCTLPVDIIPVHPGGCRRFGHLKAILTICLRWCVRFGNASACIDVSVNYDLEALPQLTEGPCVGKGVLLSGS